MEYCRDRFWIQYLLQLPQYHVPLRGNGFVAWTKHHLLHIYVCLQMHIRTYRYIQVYTLYHIMYAGTQFMMSGLLLLYTYNITQVYNCVLTLIRENRWFLQWAGALETIPLSLALASHCDKEAIRQGSSIGHLTSIRIDHQVCGKAPFQGWLCCSTQILEKWNRTNLERELSIFAFENQVKWSPWVSIRAWLLQKIFLWTLCSIHSIYCTNGWFY